MTLKYSPRYCPDCGQFVWSTISWLGEIYYYEHECDYLLNSDDSYSKQGYEFQSLVETTVDMDDLDNWSLEAALNNEYFTPVGSIGTVLTYGMLIDMWNKWQH